jgi:hypothetical protein
VIESTSSGATCNVETFQQKHILNHPDNTAHAGTAMIIKSTIEHHLLHKYEKDYLQATSVRVKTFACQITVSAVQNIES